MKAFLRSTLAAVIGTLLAVGILFTIVMGQLLAPPQESLGDALVLVLDDTVPITDAGSVIQLGAAFGQGEIGSLPLERLLLAIDRAADDGRIEAILLKDGGPAVAGFAARQALFEALARFRERGKKILAYARDFDMRDYWLNSLAQPLVMPALGTLDFSGLGVELEYYAKAMEKLGIEVQVTRVGRYKSAVEPFLLEGPSEAAREQWQVLLADLQEEMLADLAEARGLESNTMAAWIQEPAFFTAAEAQAAGLIDRVAPFDSVLEELFGLVGSAEAGDADTAPPAFAQVGLLRYLEEEDLPPEEAAGWISVIHAEGEIYDGSAMDAIGGDDLAAELRAARLDPSVDAVVLRVNSPGGSAAASEVIRREVELLGEADKPVVVSMGDVAASGGYWISCSADLIYAMPTTITGSIGVFGMFPQLRGLLDKVGVAVVPLQTGPHTDMLSLTRPRSEAEMVRLQGYVDDIYRQFLEHVANGRHLSVEEVDALGGGRVWSGRRAQAQGLVDRLGTLDDAIAAAAALAGLEDYAIDDHRPEPNALEAWLEAQLGPEDVPVVHLSTFATLWRQQLPWLDPGMLSRFTRQRGVVATLPYRWHWQSRR